MALDPRIVGAIQGPNIFGALQRGLQAEQAIRQAPILEALQQANLQQAQFNVQQAPILAEQQQQLFESKQGALEANQMLATQKQKILSATSEADKRKEVARIKANLLRQAKRLPTIEAREAFADSIDPQLLIDAGIDPDEVANLPLDDQSLTNAILANEAIFGQPQNGKQILQIRKEVRSSIGKEVGSIKKDAATITSNFNKLQNLSGQIRKGNRLAVSQGLIALVKLGDPSSIVSTNEMQAALNAQSPIAAVAGMLMGKGVSDDLARSIASKVDPLNPSNVNVDDLLATASSLVQSNVPVIQSRLASEQERAGENLTEAGIRSIFSQKILNAISDLSNLQTTTQDTTAPEKAIGQVNVGQSFNIGGVEIKRVR